MIVCVQGNLPFASHHNNLCLFVLSASNARSNSQSVSSVRGWLCAATRRRMTGLLDATGVRKSKTKSTMFVTRETVEITRSTPHASRVDVQGWSHTLDARRVGGFSWRSKVPLGLLVLRHPDAHLGCSSAAAEPVCIQKIATKCNHTCSYTRTHSRGTRSRAGVHNKVCPHLFLKSLF